MRESAGQPSITVSRNFLSIAWPWIPAIRLFVGTSSSGVFRSLDGGASWTPVNTGLVTATVWELALDPANPATVYAGNIGSGVLGAGVFRSPDRGDHWTPLNAGLANPVVVSLAIDPSGTQLHAGTYGSGVNDLQIALPCTPAADRLCLLSNRFRVTLEARDPRTGTTASGQAIPQGDRFGYFSLPVFTGDPAFPEVFVKMLDATALGGFFWVFHTGLTDLEYTMTVLDTATGGSKTYRNDRSDPTRLCGGADTGAFPGQPLTAGAFGIRGFGLSTVGAASCVPSDNDLCLLSGRFRVSLTAVDPRTGTNGIGRAISQSDRFGYFSLPTFTGDATFPEVFVKMLDATSLPGAFFWSFHSGLTDLQYTMTITDTVRGTVKTYQNDRSDPSRLCGGADTSAFQ
jgi:hypothetical protein